MPVSIIEGGIILELGFFLFFFLINFFYFNLKSNEKPNHSRRQSSLKKKFTYLWKNIGWYLTFVVERNISLFLFGNIRSEVKILTETLGIFKFASRYFSFAYFFSLYLFREVISIFFTSLKRKNMSDLNQNIHPPWKMVSFYFSIQLNFYYISCPHIIFPVFYVKYNFRSWAFMVLHNFPFFVTLSTYYLS